jgi:hypothetical protein
MGRIEQLQMMKDMGINETDIIITELLKNANYDVSRAIEMYYEPKATNSAATASTTPFFTTVPNGKFSSILKKKLPIGKFNSNLPSSVVSNVSNLSALESNSISSQQSSQKDKIIEIDLDSDNEDSEDKLNCMKAEISTVSDNNIHNKVSSTSSSSNTHISNVNSNSNNLSNKDLNNIDIKSINNKIIQNKSPKNSFYFIGRRSVQGYTLASGYILRTQNLNFTLAKENGKEKGKGSNEVLTVKETAAVSKINNINHMKKKSFSGGKIMFNTVRAKAANDQARDVHGRLPNTICDFLVPLLRAGIYVYMSLL